MPTFQIMKTYQAHETINVEAENAADALAFAARWSTALCYECNRRVELVELKSLPLPRVIAIDGKSQGSEERYSYDEQLRRERARACGCYGPPFEDR